MKNTLALLALLALSGCAHTRYLTRDCVSREQVEKLRAAEPPKVREQLTGQADKDLTIVSGSAIRLRVWGSGILGVLEGCTTK